MPRLMLISTAWYVYFCVKSMIISFVMCTQNRLYKKKAFLEFLGQIE